MSLILKAAKWADTAHSDQKRKLTGRPYVEHCGRVAARMSRHEHADENVVCAAWLHDVLEDTDVTVDQLAWNFPGAVIQHVQKLTNPSKAFPDLPRAKRKEMDRDHLRNCYPIVRMIKLADRTDNMRDACHPNADKDWAQTYIKESHTLLFAIMIPNEALWYELRASIKEAATYFDMTEQQVRGEG